MSVSSPWTLNLCESPGIVRRLLAMDNSSAARRVVFRLASKVMPRGIRDALWLLRGLRGPSAALLPPRDSLCDTTSAHVDDDFGPSLTGSDVANGIGSLAQRERPIDHRRQLSGLDELLEDDEVVITHRGDVRHEALAHDG